MPEMCVRCGDSLGVVPVRDTEDPETGEEITGPCCIECVGELGNGDDPLEE